MAILNYDGSGFRAQMSGTKEELRSIYAATAAEAFACGTRGTMLRFVAGAWSPVSLGTTQSLEAVHGRLADNVVVTAASGAAFRYDGNVWKSLPTGTSNRLDGVYVTSSEAWMVGDFGTILTGNS